MTRDEVVAALDRLVDLALAQFSQGGVVNVEREVQALADLVPTSTDPMHFIMASEVATLLGISRAAVSKKQKKNQLPLPVAVVNSNHMAWLPAQFVGCGSVDED